jgi:hypothetical protein
MLEQKDYILREIEKISALLLGLIGRLISVKEKAFEDENEWVSIKKDFADKILFDLDEIISTPVSGLEKLLTVEHGFDPANIELLADLIAKTATTFKFEPEIRIKRAIEMYELANRKSSTWSMERAEKIDHLKSLKM